MEEGTVDGESAVLRLAFAILAISVPLRRATQDETFYTAEEIERAKSSASTAYEVVEMLRPRWFSKRELAKIPGTPTEAPQSTGVRVWLTSHNAGDAIYLGRFRRNGSCDALVRRERGGEPLPATDGQASIEVTLSDRGVAIERGARVMEPQVAVALRVWRVGSRRRCILARHVPVWGART